MDWRLVKKDPSLLEDAIIARDKEINSLLKNILVHLTPESHDYDIAVKTATNCRMILAIKRDGTVKCRLVKQGFRENCSVTDGPDFHYASYVLSDGLFLGVAEPTCSLQHEGSPWPYLSICALLKWRRVNVFSLHPASWRAAQ